MNKDNYNKAMDKIKASEEFKNRIKTAVISKKATAKASNYKKVMAIAAMVIVILSAGYYVNINDKMNINDISNNFEIIGKSEGEACYITVVYMDGYSYEASSWYSHSVSSFLDDVDDIKGEKLGAVTLDLKGKMYTGTPPDFSSTLDVGTEIYEIKGIKKENSVLAVAGDMKVVLYSQRKANSTNEPINLTIEELINRISIDPVITSLELRSEEDSSWMRSTTDANLLALLYKEIKNENIMSYDEIGKKYTESSYRIPINILFKEGGALHMQVYPEKNLAYIFGGYINISNKLAQELENLYKMGYEFSKITEILEKDLNDVEYFKLTNHRSGEELISSEPRWSGEALYWYLSYYSAEKSQIDLIGEHVYSLRFGASEENSELLEIYEGTDENLYFKIDGIYYILVKGYLRYKDLLNFQENYIS